MEEMKCNLDEGFNIRNYIGEGEMSEAEIDRCEFWVTANRIVRNSGKENHEKEKIQVNFDWDLEKMEKMLDDYEDKEVVQYLRYGWPLNAVNTAVNPTVPRNQKGARSHPDELRKYLKEEIKNGSIIGPFKENPFGKHARFSPLDTRPKRDSDDLRVILNLSYPADGASVNSSIGKETYGEDVMKLSYPSVETLAHIIRRKKKQNNKVKMFKRDLSKAYRQLWASPSSVHLLGYSFENRFYYDVSLSMGSASSAYCCQRTTDAIVHIHKKKQFDSINYLDDLGGAECENKAEESYNYMGEILQEVGIRESKSKACPPAFIMIFLGVLFNSFTMTMTITEDRLIEIRNMLKEWIGKKKANLKEVQSILGKLNFAAGTVRAGRIFVARLINELHRFPQNGNRMKISVNMKKDIQWWYTFM